MDGLQAGKLVLAWERQKLASGAAGRPLQVWFTILTDFRRTSGFTGNSGFPIFVVFQQNTPLTPKCACCSISR